MDFSELKNKFKLHFELELNSNPKFKFLMYDIFVYGSAYIVGGYLRDFLKSKRSRDIDITSARNFLGEKKIIGVSCYNNIKLSLSAEKKSASYVSFGSLYNTSTKSNASNLNEITFVSAKKVLSIPICLIGGINSDNIHYVIKLNSDLIAISKGLSSNDKLEYISNVYYE